MGLGAYREDRLPVWARTALTKLRYELQTALDEAALLKAENGRLRALIESKAMNDGSDTFLINDDTAKLPLGKGVTVTFGRSAQFYVRWSAETFELLVECYDDMWVKPEHKGFIVIAAAADVTEK